MSRERRRDELRYTAGGREYVVELTHNKAMPSAGSLPREHRAAIYDEAGHLIAVLVANGPNEPLVEALGPHGVVPVLVLLDDGLCAAIISFDDQGRAVVGALGQPAPSGSVRCWQCSTDNVVPAAALHSAMVSTKTRPPRVRALRSPLF